MSERKSSPYIPKFVPLEATPLPAAIDLERMDSAAAATCSRGLASLTLDATTRAAAAGSVIDYLYRALRTGDGGPACVLARCFTTSPYARLPLDYRDAADRLLEDIPSQRNMRCLAMLATRGQKTLWNDPATSMGHKAIPLPSAEVVRQAPMIARLLDQFGLRIEEFVTQRTEAAGFVVDDTLPGSFNVFHIAQAEGSPYIPAQEDFVKPFGVRSVLGMGGLLPDGELFAVLLFTRVSIAAETAAMFREVGEGVCEALRRFPSDRTFAAEYA